MAHYHQTTFGAKLRDLEFPDMMPIDVVRGYSFFYARYEEQTDWHDLADSILWGELCLCILSSNVQFETARSALGRLLDEGLLHRNGRNKLSRTRIADELARPLYLPRRKNGLLRRYRFPNVRASNLAGAWDVLYRQGNGVKSLLEKSSSVDETRLYFVEMIPGLGLKEASHFLRNVKFTDSMAIIDTHIIEFLREFMGLNFPRDNGVTRAEYLELEKLMREISNRFNLSLAALDMAIWDWMRRRRT